MIERKLYLSLRCLTAILLLICCSNAMGRSFGEGFEVDSMPLGDAPILVAHLEKTTGTYSLESIQVTFEANSGSFSSEVLPWKVFSGSLDSNGHPGFMAEVAGGTEMVMVGDVLPKGAVWVDVPDSNEAWIEVFLDVPIILVDGAHLIAFETTASKMLSLDRLGYERLDPFVVDHNSYVSEDGGDTWVPLTEDELVRLAGELGTSGGTRLQLQNNGRP